MFRQLTRRCSCHGKVPLCGQILVIDCSRADPILPCDPANNQRFSKSTQSDRKTQESAWRQVDSPHGSADSSLHLRYTLLSLLWWHPTCSLEYCIEHTVQRTI